MIATDVSHHPIAIVVIWNGIQMDDVEALRQLYAGLHGRAQRFATILDVRRAGIPPAPVRRALGGLSHEFGDATRRDVVTVATILDNKVLVGALTAIRWFVREDVDLRYFASARETLRYVDGLFKNENIHIPQVTRTFVERLDTASEDELASFSDARSG